MPRTTIKNLIIFGDSMSDIGTKAQTGMGGFAGFFGLMQVNELGRFSDGRNWTDFLWEWAGGTSMFRAAQVRFEIPDEPPPKPALPPTSPLIESRAATVVHRSLTVDSDQDSGRGLTDPSDPSSGSGRAFTYVNYAEGGAMGASDRSKIGCGTFRDQINRFTTQVRARPLHGETLFIIWFGLNDLVTNNRDPDTMSKVVNEMFRHMRTLRVLAGGTAHFLLINLPDPSDAVRFVNLPREDPKKVRYTSGATVFNAYLAAAVALGYAPEEPDDKRLVVGLVDMFNILKAVTRSPARMAENHLRPGAQSNLPALRYPTIGPLPSYPPLPPPPGGMFRIPPPPSSPSRRSGGFRPHPPSGPPPSSSSSSSSSSTSSSSMMALPRVPPISGPPPPTPIATSDLAHPTEAVYRVMARYIARSIVTRFEIGSLARHYECRGVRADPH
ncbi:hypothetical protein KRR26_32445 [Corallococcus sp. M34]|uniref:SGNH/GDSL hydrolase family protein n=1 Tax=Citreicoccus inhibens TaxID=2849499 RepID=UPI001C210655|nr:SGNH/GDSL hydrolase family protein [Citreicoccus inhibens]MBU8900328.1 hypothetical protein [Citreicoccus inhibens]